MRFTYCPGRKATGRSSGVPLALKGITWRVVTINDGVVGADGGPPVDDEERILNALRSVFGADADRVVVTNTKGFTGHAMGAGIEDDEQKCPATNGIFALANFSATDRACLGSQASSPTCSASSPPRA